MPSSAGFGFVPRSERPAAGHLRVSLATLAVLALASVLCMLALSPPRLPGAIAKLAAIAEPERAG